MMDDETQEDKPNVQADDNSIAVGSINVAGNFAGNIIIGHTTGYTSEQVSTLITQISATFQPKPFDGRCPYKGLDVFEEEDAGLFFGRENLVEDLVNRVRESRTVFITGPSGSGKSSLVRAGLIHDLKQGTIKESNSDRWLYATLKPGRDPIGELGRVAAGLASSTNAEDEIRAKAIADATIFARWCEIALKEGRDKRVVLFIDQFEEVFTQINNEAERVAFLNLLTHAAMVENGRVTVLFSMRSDFVSNCATYPELNALLNQQFLQIGAMKPDELVSAIAQPALRVGLRIDPDLIAQIINDMQGEPGALPLMQFALKDLFDSQQEKGGMIALTLNDYIQRGGIRKALERHADDAFAKLSEGEQELAHSIFSGLIEIGRGTQDTRRTALFDELIPANTKAEDVETIVQKLADARLITTDEIGGKDTVTISHEKLIDAWPWLKKLVNENRDVIALQNEIASDAKEWDDHHRDPSYLYTGARLANVREQLKANKLILSGLAQDFIQTGHVRRRRGQSALIAGLSAILALLFLAVIVFRNQSQQNAEIANTAQAALTSAVAQQVTAQANAEEAARMAMNAHIRELAALSIAWQERNLALSLLLGIEVFKTENNAQMRGLLLDNLQFNPQLLRFLRAHTDSVTTVAFGPDGKILASGSDDHTIVLWDMNTHQPIGQPLTGHSGSVNSVVFSPDGKILASGSADSTIILWDMATYQPIGQPLTGHLGSVVSVAFSPNGNILASGSDDSTIILWDVATYHPIGQPLTGHLGSVASVAFSPDEKILASGSRDKTITLWDMNTQQPIGQSMIGHSGSVNSVAFSPDGKILASGSDDNTIILWDVNTNEPIEQPLRGHINRVTNVAFSPDGKMLASGSYDNTMILWNVNTHQRIGQPLKGHSDWLFSVAFSPNGEILASGSADNALILWEVTRHQRIDQRLIGYSDPVNSVAFSPNGEILASGSYNNTVILWNVNTNEPIGQPFMGHTNQVRSVAFSPDGKILASGSDDHTIVLWDMKTHQPIGRPLTGHSGSVNSVVFSPDGKILASGSADSTIILWDMTTYQPIGQPLMGHTDQVRNVVFSLNGEMLASGSNDKTIILWDVNTHEPIGRPLTGHTDHVRNVAFSLDGKMLASGGDDHAIILWDVNTHQRLGQPLIAHSASVASVAFSPDGEILASGSYDNTIILWDVATHQSIGQPLIGHLGSVYTIAFSPDGNMLASGSIDLNVILWDMDPESWLAKSCQRAGRNFTRVEWALYFPNEEYLKSCEQWPLEPETVSNPRPVP